MFKTASQMENFQKIVKFIFVRINHKAKNLIKEDVEGFKFKNLGPRYFDIYYLYRVRFT